VCYRVATRRLVPSFSGASLLFIFFPLSSLPLDPEEDMVYLRSPTIVVDSFVSRLDSRSLDREAMQEAMRCWRKARLPGGWRRFEIGETGREERKKNALALRRDSRVAIRRINDSVSGVTPGVSFSFPHRSLEYRIVVEALAGGPKIVARRLDCTSEVASAFINQRYVRLALTLQRRMFLGMSTRTSTRSASV